MNIAGVLVTAIPGNAARLQRRLEQLPGVEVHASTSAGQLVVTVEADEDAQAHCTLVDLERLDEVHSIALVFHYRDPVEQA